MYADFESVHRAPRYFEGEILRVIEGPRRKDGGLDAPQVGAEERFATELEVIKQALALANDAS